MFLYEREGKCGSSRQVLVCRVLVQCCPGQRATGDNLDYLSPRWIFVQKFSLDQIKGSIFTAIWPTYFPSDAKWPWWRTQDSCSCRTVPYHCSWLSGTVRLGQRCLPETGHVICLPWCPWCPIYLSAKDQINKKFPCYL